MDNKRRKAPLTHLINELTNIVEQNGGQYGGAYKLERFCLALSPDSTSFCV